jgi:hypothetical protein
LVVGTALRQLISFGIFVHRIAFLEFTPVVIFSLLVAFGELECFYNEFSTLALGIARRLIAGS